MDTFTLSNFTGLTENGAASTGSTLSTGDLRRKYNFGNMVSELRVERDPFFGLASKFRKVATDDPQFKFAEKRHSFHKRYAYVVGHSTDGSSYTTDNATVTATDIELGDTWFVKMKTDYKHNGNVSSRFGNASSAINVGAAGTQPQFFLPNQIVKINFGTAYNVPKDYILGKIEAVTKGSSEDVDLQLRIVRTLNDTANVELQWSDATTPMSAVYNIANANTASGLESKRCYVVGNAHAKGSGYPETWADNPYSTGYGLTQIWKTALAMDNTTRATNLKYDGNEYGRIWGEKLIEHKWDIETDMLFGSQYTDGEGVQYTQGIVDYITQYGNIFSLDISTKTCDDFLEDLSQYSDPRYVGGSMSTVFMCDTVTYNWLNKLSGYFSNNISIDAQYRGDFAFERQGLIGKVPINTISTIYGNINVTRNIHLDGSGIRIVACDMSKMKYRPLVGNGLNRDTSVYVGVQTLENSGVDKRVDLILTEAGCEFTAPECHAIWK